MSNKQNLDRRDFLKTTALTIAGAGLLSVQNSSQAALSPSPKVIQTEDFSTLIKEPPKGMSSRQVEDHLGLYKGYVSKYNNVIELEKKSGPDHDTLLKKGFAYGGIVLHELYFRNLSQFATSVSAHSPLLDTIRHQYGSYDRLLSTFKKAAKVSRGWTVLGLNLFDNRLDVYSLDVHNEGTCLTFVHPVLVIDVYEHAYMIDHGTNKTAYIDEFVHNINWPVVQARYQQALDFQQKPLII